ncbi:DNA damage repair protein [Grosmannia clavigera kw1407]|uniref:DNA damage repair protein n=1 Tax=Grosmannia clavigera (strain kw1407 / UAMH 11150) TaxID=655863 RepID=F0XG99_GROCL|nr:DNA damage repair protein [Grosmannia clavigera kw1407]EFX03041.1 DNA damage repair protein [Grosmannia clavigera kw1407]
MPETHAMDPTVGTAPDPSQSPTQSNEDRSYDRFEDPESLPPFILGALAAGDPPGDDELLPDRSLDEEDSGAVRFSLYSVGLYSEESPPASDVDRSENRRSHFFAASEDDKNDKFASAAARMPQTPRAPSKNPFAGQYQTPLLAGSQLFAQTPFSTAFQQGSPTSSRPSPSGYPAPATTPRAPVSSSLKPRFPASSVGDETPVLLCPLTTSSQPGDSPRPSPIPQSSPVRPKRRAHGPISEYEPMRESQRRREASERCFRRDDDDFGSSSDDDVQDVSLKRRRLAAYKREAGARTLSTINMSRPSFREDAVEVPASRSKDKSLEGGPPATAEPGDPQSEDFEEVEFPQSMIDQYSARPPPIAKTPSSSVPSLPAIALTMAKDAKANPTLFRTSSLNETEAIPETSPVGRKSRPTQMASSGDYPQPRAEMTPQHVAGSSAQTAILIQTPLPISQRAAVPPQTRGRGANTVILSDVPEHEFSAEQQEVQRTPPARASLQQTPDQELDHATAGRSSPPALPPAFSTRAWSRRATGDAVATKAKRPSLTVSTSSRDSSVSTMSSLSSTPSLPSREATPTTANTTANESDLSACKSDRKADTAATTAASATGDEYSSPPLPVSRLPFRRQRSKISRSKAGSTGSLGRPRTASRRQESPLLSGSTDELAQSPGSVGSRARRSGGRFVSLKPTSGLFSAGAGARIFEGMVFAISFQSQRPDESAENCEERTRQAQTLRRKIEEAGGRVLQDGFDELFKVRPVMTATPTAETTGEDLQLVASAADTGFTALIADGHSRKAKYMQALALGLPCLAVRWATTCLERGRVVDWAPYLLCAGPSVFLGDAIRSRAMPAQQTATDVSLAAIVHSRPRLLDHVTILLVLRKREDPRRMPYVFLAQVLGAALTRVHGLEEAREQLLAMEDAGRPYDWVYEDGRAGGGADLFQSLAAAGRKRKRPSSGTAGSLAARMPRRVAMLSNERVIQSLIFGRLIEEDEMAM